MLRGTGKREGGRVAAGQGGAGGGSKQRTASRGSLRLLDREESREMCGLAAWGVWSPGAPAEGVSCELRQDKR